MANALKIKLNEAENRIVNGLMPQEVFDKVSSNYSANDVDGRYARSRIAKKIRFTPSLPTRRRLASLRVLLIIFLFFAAIVVFLNKQNRFEVFGFFLFNSIPSFIFFFINNIFVWIYLFCAFALLRWRLSIVWATISFTAIDLIRVSFLFPEHLSINPVMAVLRLLTIFIVLIFSIIIISKSQNRYKIDKKNYSISFLERN